MYMKYCTTCLTSSMATCMVDRAESNLIFIRYTMFINTNLIKVCNGIVQIIAFSYKKSCFIINIKVLVTKQHHQIFLKTN